MTEENLRYVGQPEVRIDGREKVAGAAQYVEDLDFGPSLLYAEVVESTEAHALIKSIDASEAEAMEGVLRVVTGKDLPYTFGLYMEDRYILAQDRVRFVGEQVAVVVARTHRTARKAAQTVKVEYEPLDPVLDPLKAADPRSTLVHPDLKDYPHVPWFFPQPETNIAHWRKIRRGDVDEAFAKADVVVEDTFKVPRYSHCAIEVHAAVGKYDHSGRLTVWTASQSPHTQRNIFAQVLAPLGITHKDVRVITPYVGGGFGGKAGVTMEILAASIAMLVKGNPVKVCWSRSQEFYNTYQRQGLVARVKLAATKDGTITAIEHEMHWDAGAYVEYGANVVNATGLSATGPYRIPNLKIDSKCIYTNLPPGGPYRGFGYSEFGFGLESQITRLAEALGMDPVELRRKNAIVGGDELAYGAKVNKVGSLECIDKVAEAIEWGKLEQSPDPTKVIGKGFSMFWKAPAMPPNASSAAFLKFNEDGSMNILVSGMEIGQGYFVVMAQIAAEVLGVPPSKIRVETPDTDRNPYEWQTVASHVTWSCGNAVKRAAIDARDQIFDLVERAHFIPRSALYLEDEAVRSYSDPDFTLPLRNFVIDGIMDPKTGRWMGGPILGRGMYMPEFASSFSDPETGQGGKPNVHYTVGAAAITLEIDKETGRMRILKAVEAVDCGKAINPSMVEGQIIGGLLQGLATVMFEDMRFDERGKLLNPTFTDYKIPTAMDIPEVVVPIIVEVPQPDGPYGARGMAEHTMIPAAPMVAGAVASATGVWLKSMPITAEKIALALKNKK